ncbi:hypothetical protein [Methylopila sp. Yamaguchi]|uniref:hypothetical protein n=1 Tax=Methylopila sp. Yamaguchi TaxID=1437817 RepID=UPI000CBF28D1|nr:hypothetical protein [Methylopila sp. Yamaguchi]GBD49096.1 hypothetical protein METY_2309 [Methylopila sp. Yamaguchi]
MPVTTAESDEAFKVREHRRERRAVAIALAGGTEPPALKAFGDPWDGDKDGKVWNPDDPTLIRAPL